MVPIRCSKRSRACPKLAVFLKDLIGAFITHDFPTYLKSFNIRAKIILSACFAAIGFLLATFITPKLLLLWRLAGCVATWDHATFLFAARFNFA
jgi:hypothetical protein